jgi:transposase
VRPFLARGWAVRRSKPVALIKHTRDYFYVMLARSRRKILAAFYCTVNQRKIIRFLKELLRHYPRLVVIMDRGPGHRGPLLKAFLRRNRKCLRIIYFPTHSPELNPVEQCNKEIKKPLHNRYFSTLPAMRQAVKRFLKKDFLMPKMFAYLCP